MSEHATDVVVVGGGPSGLAAALSVARAGASVVLCEPQGTVFDKPCGEGVLPRGVAVLERLGVALETRERAPFRGLEYWIGGCRRARAAARLGGVERGPPDAPWRARPRARDARRPPLAGARRRRIGRPRAFVVHDRSGARLRAEVVIEATGARGRASAARGPGARPRQRRSRRRARRARALRPLDHVEIHRRLRRDLPDALARGRINVAVLSRARRGRAAWRPRRLRRGAPFARIRRSSGCSARSKRSPRAARSPPRLSSPRRVPGGSRAAITPSRSIRSSAPVSARRSRAARRPGSRRWRSSPAPTRSPSRARHARWVARATSRARSVAGALLFLSEHASLAGSVAGALAHAPALSRACVRRAHGRGCARAPRVLPR